MLNRLQLLGIYNESVFIFSLRALRAERDIMQNTNLKFLLRKKLRNVALAMHGHIT